MLRPASWFFTVAPLFKILQILCSFCIIGFIITGRHQWTAYAMIYLTYIVVPIICAVLLVLQYFDVVRTNTSVPWFLIEFGWNLAIAAISLLYAIILCVDLYLLFYKNNWHHDYYLKEFGPTGWRNRVCLITSFVFTQVFLFAGNILHNYLHGFD